MAEIPKIVAQRLRNNPPAEVHLDPNLIAAFAENSLKRDERIQVLAHLAQCADCREVVLLSAPEQVAAVSDAAGGRTSWLAWPVLRWASAAACIVVVGAAVGLHYRARPVSDSEIANRRTDVPALEAKLAPESSTPAASRESVATLQSSQPVQAKRDATPRTAAKHLDQLTQLDRRTPQAPAVADSFRKEKEQTANERNGGMAKTESTVEVTAAATGAGTEAEDKSSDKMAQLVPGRAKDAAQEPPPSNANLGYAGGMVAKQAMGSPLATHKAPLPLAANIVPRWTLSADGTLQRSLDSGRSWETIPFPNQSTFRALAANGLEIWVGGAKGVLYHSADAGQRWKLVQPAANGQLLTADIIRVEFTDSQHGVLNTSDKQAWVTEDGGQSWQKQ